MRALFEGLENRTLFANPMGNFDAVGPTGFVSGWAADLDTPGQSIFVHVYVDNQLVAGALADQPRSDVNAVIGIPGNHGFGLQLPQPWLDGRQHTIQIYGINTGAGTNQVLSSSGKRFTNAAPIGVHDGISSTGIVYGWAFDPSNPGDSIAVHMYVDGVLQAGVLAGDPRGDVNQAYGITGNHGFGWQLPPQFMDGRTHTVQAWAIDSQGGINVLTINTGKKFSNPAPMGVHDAVSATGWVSGWAFDPSNPGDSIAVHMYVDGVLQAGVLAGDYRPDVNQAYGITGNHGFGWQLPQQFMDGRTHTVQAWAIDSQGGINVLTINTGKQFANPAPIGTHDAISSTGWVSGWAFDPSNPSDSIAVHIYVDGILEAGVNAGDARADVNQAFGIGGNHGFGWQLPEKFMDGQPHFVQVWAIDSQGGINVLTAGTGKTFTSAEDLVNKRKRLEPESPAKGVQTVLLGRYLDDSLNNLIDVLTAQGAPDKIEIGFVANYNLDPTHQYANARRLLDALLGAGKTVYLVTHFSFHGISVGETQIKQSSGNPFMLADIGQYKTLVDDYKPHIEAGHLTMIASPSLEDQYHFSDFEKAATAIVTRMGESAKYIRLRRSTVKEGESTKFKGGNITRTGNSSSFKLPGSDLSIPVDFEIHGLIGDSTGKFASYSNDGNFVYFRGDIAGPKKLAGDGTPDEDDTSAHNATGPDDKDHKYSFSQLNDAVHNNHYSGTVLLWRPAYNLLDRRVSKITGHRDFVFNTKKQQGVPEDRKDDIAHFDRYEQLILASFLGVKKSALAQISAVKAGTANVAVKFSQTAVASLFDDGSDGSSSKAPLDFASLQV